MIYLLLFAGLFMGWSLGTNDAANAFGTAVATRVVKYRTAVIIIAILIVWCHRANLQRIANRTENKISFGKKKDELQITEIEDSADSDDEE